MLIRPFLVAVLVATLAFGGCIKDPLGGQITGRAVEYLVRAQNADGGWPSVPEGVSDFSTTCWVVLALAAANAPALILDKAKQRLALWADNVSRNDTGSFSASNAVALYVLAGLALDVPEADWAGTRPLARLQAYTSNQTLAMNEKIFVLGALGRAGLVSQAQALRDDMRAKLDGGNETELGSDGWFRSMGVLALLASGDDPESEASRMWARSLLPYQKDEGGFFSSPQYEPDASTTAAVLAVLTKIRFVYSSDRTAATEFLGEMQQPEGWIRFSQEYDFGRAKTTAEAVLGLTGAGVFGA